MSLLEATRYSLYSWRMDVEPRMVMLPSSDDDEEEEDDDEEEEEGEDDVRTDIVLLWGAVDATISFLRLISSLSCLRYLA